MNERLREVRGVMTEVVFLLAPRLHLLDLAGPAQAFSTAADFGAGYRLHYLGEQEEIPTTQQLPVRAGLDWPTLSPADLIVVPGWRREPGPDPRARSPMG